MKKQIIINLKKKQPQEAFKMNNYNKAIEFIETAPEDSLRELLKELIFYNDSEFIEEFIVDENNL